MELFWWEPKKGKIFWMEFSINALVNYTTCCETKDFAYVLLHVVKNNHYIFFEFILCVKQWPQTCSGLASSIQFFSLVWFCCCVESFYIEMWFPHEWFADCQTLRIFFAESLDIERGDCLHLFGIDDLKESLCTIFQLNWCFQEYWKIEKLFLPELF